MPLSNTFNVTVRNFPLYSVYSAIITDRGGIPVAESNTRYWNKPTYPTGGTVYNSIAALEAAIAADPAQSIVNAAGA